MKDSDRTTYGDWIGKVVEITDQKMQSQGFGWGWRYKVRIQGTFSENDNVPNDQLPYASVMMGVTDGSGAGGRMKSVKITQNDMVYGIYMAPDQNFPVITGVLPPTKGKIDSGGKFGVGSGFTENLKPGMAARQEFNEQDSPATPRLREKENTTGSGRGKAVPAPPIRQRLGIDPNQIAQLNALPTPPGAQKFDMNGFTPEEIQGYIDEEKTINQRLGVSQSDLDTELDAELAKAKAGDRSGLENALEF